jgi:exosortase
LTELNPQASLVGGVATDRAGALRSGDDTYLGLSLETWVKVGVLAPLFVAVYWLVIRWLWDKTNPIWGEANWQHAVAIPLVGLYYLYINRDDLLKQPVEPLVLGRFTAPWRLAPGAAMFAVGLGCYLFGGNYASGFVKIGGAVLGGFGLLIVLFDWAIASLLFGLIMFAYGIWPGQNQFVQGCAMILTLFGVVLMLTGWRVMQYAWFPIAYLICGIPWPPLVYSYIASPLQVLAAGVAVNALRFTGVTAYRSGTKIHMASTSITEPMRTLNVAEACAGLRSLMTFITVGVAVAFLSARPLWQKIIITISAIPIAIFCNVMRVAGQGLLDHYVSEQLSQSFAHQFVGIVMLIPAFFMILAVGWVLDHLFVEEADDNEKNYATPGAMAASPAQAFPVGGVAAVAPAGGLVVDIPRRPAGPKVKPVPPEAQTHVAPRAVPAPAAKAQGTAKPHVAPAKAQATPKPPPAAKPAAAVTPPRPGIVPPRPGIVPPRPAQAQPTAQPQQKQQPQPQPQPPQPKRPPATQEGA